MRHKRPTNEFAEVKRHPAIGALTVSAAAALMLIVLGVQTTLAYELASPIDPAISASPIEVFVWFLDDTDPADVGPTLDRLRLGLDMLEDVPTCALAFTIVGSVISTTEPVLPDEQLLVVAYHHDKLASELPYEPGADSPINGFPVRWVGLLTDLNQGEDIYAHEIGHNVGLGHSTISDYFPVPTHPVMNWRADGLGILLADDVAALSHLYPHPVNTLASTTGAISGRVVSNQTSAPVGGVNVVAVQIDDPVNPIPQVARLTGGRGLADGTFELLGIPPGEYELYFLDGRSYHGRIPLIDVPSDLNACHWLRGGFQVDNFVDMQMGPYTVTAGSQIGLGDVAINIEPMAIETYQEGAFVDETTLTLLSGYELPEGLVGQPYELWLHISGGQRDIVGQATGLPAGLNGRIECDARFCNTGVHGSTYYRITGTPTTPGNYTLDLELTDLAGEVDVFSFNITIQPLPPEGPVVHYHFSGNTLDSSGNMRDGQVKWLGAAQSLSWPADRQGVLGQALAIDGQIVEAPDEAAFDLRDYSLAMVFKLDKQNTEEWLLSKGTLFGNYAMRRLGPSAGGNPGYVGFTHRTHGGNWSHLTSDGPVGAGDWTCLVVNISAEGFEGWDESEPAWTSGAVPPPRYNDAPLNVGGGGYYDLSSTMVGVLDDFAVYSGILAPDAISDYCTWQILPDPAGGADDGASNRSAWNALHVTRLAANALDGRPAKEFIRAAEHLSKALNIHPKHPTRAWVRNVDLWQDGNHLDPKAGEKVFLEFEEAAKRTARTCDKHVSTCEENSRLVKSAQNYVVGAASQLATTALRGAISTPGLCEAQSSGTRAKRKLKCPPSVVKAKKELDQGAADAAKGQAAKAIEHYKTSWKKSQDAMAHTERLRTRDRATSSSREE